MNHYELKNQIAGAGSKKQRKPKPATLTPPKLGDYEVASSYGYSEILDLISDGPIEGLTNKQGYVLPYNSLLQGVYLNNVPVEESNLKFLPNFGEKTFLKEQEAFASGFSQIFENIYDADIDDTLGEVDTKSITELYQVFVQYNNKFLNVNNFSTINAPSTKYAMIFDQNSQAEGEIDAVTRGTDADYTANPEWFTNKSKNISYNTLLTENDMYYYRETVSNKYKIDFSLTPQYFTDLFYVNDTNIKNGIDEFLDIFQNGNLYMREYAKGVLLNLGFEEEDVRAKSIGKNEVISFFESKYNQKYSDWYWKADNTLQPHVCIKINGVIDGFEEKSHSQFFLKKDSDGNLTSELNYLAGFNLESYSNSEYVDVANNTSSFLVPILSSDGTWNGKVKGFYFFALDVENITLFDIESTYPYPANQQHYIESRNVGARKDIDALTILHSKVESEFLKNIAGFSLVNKYEIPTLKLGKQFFDVTQGGEQYQDNSSYNAFYECYAIEHQVVDTGGCVLAQKVKRKLIESGAVNTLNPKWVTAETQKLFASDVIRRGVQIKYTFMVLCEDEDMGMAFYVDEIVGPGTTYRKNSGTSPAPYNGRREVTVRIDNEEVLGSNWSPTFKDEYLLPTSLLPVGFRVRKKVGLQRVVIDYHLYMDEEVPTSCPFTIQQIPDFSISIEPLFDSFNQVIQNNTKTSSTDTSDKIKSEPPQAVKYNWSNVLAEFRNGFVDQKPLDYFQDVHVDYNYNYTLLGPFAPNGRNIQKVVQNFDNNGNLKKLNGNPRLNFNSNSVPQMDEDFLYSIREGSSDNRTTIKGLQKFADWDKLDQDYSEKAQPLTHTIENPNTHCVWFTLAVDKLIDTVQQSVGDPEDPVAQAGTQIPGVMNFRVEVGYIEANGQTETVTDKFFQICAMIESTALIDVGNPYNAEASDAFGYIREIGTGADTGGFLNCNQGFFDTFGGGGLFECFVLPPVKADGEADNRTNNQEHSSRKRFVRITKLSTESNSTLSFKEMGVLKITEVTKGNLRYPFTAYSGLKLDARVFSDIPKRAYRAKLKKVKIPINYFPTHRNGKDRRYYDTAAEYLQQDLNTLQIYKGDWDGRFKVGWTDNPAWIIYDLITNNRYGLGQHIDESEVNKWDLYKIGRFCDSVDKYGYFIGLPDDRGGIEPRFACNIMFSQETRIFDAINTIANMFRGVVYYNNGTIEFSDDSPKEPVAMFTNSNVKEGVFTYSNPKRNERINTVEVAYLDRFNGFKNKLELVRNEEDITKRGIFKKTATAFGCTSKSMARRYGEYLMSESTIDNQSVAFTCGMEALLCKPGDLIIIEDDLKSFTSNYGKVLDINQEKYSIRISDVFDSGVCNPEIMLYKPSEIIDITSIEESSKTVKSRLDYFTIQNNNSDLTGVTGWSNFLGQFTFDSYSGGYESVFSNGLYLNPLQQEYAIYKKSDKYDTSSGSYNVDSTIWFDTGAQGWVFSTGEYAKTGEKENNNLFILRPEIFSFKDLQLFDENNLTITSLNYYDTGSPDKRGAFVAYFTGGFLYEDPLRYLVYTFGNESITSSIGSPTQVFRVPITGKTSYEFGDEVFVDPTHYNANLLQFVPDGTTYRFQIKSKKETVYKVNSIREEDNNEFSIVAKSYNTGKYGTT